jgi:hypothetical protein
MTTLPVAPAGSGHRSTLVTVVAWVFLAFSALATLGALLQVLVLAIAPAADVNRVVNRVAQDTAFTHLLPRPYLFMLHHWHLVALIKLTWWAVVLVASIGVLQRKEWARRTFVAVLAIGVVQLIGALVLSQSIMMSVAAQIASTSGRNQMPPGMGSGMALAGLLMVGIGAILLWLLFSFRSARVREEFAGTQHAA